MAKKRIFAAILAAVMAISCCACGEDNDDDDDDDKPKKDKTSSSQSQSIDDSKDEGDKVSKPAADSKPSDDDDNKPADSKPSDDDNKPAESKPDDTKPAEGGASSGDVSALMGDWHVVKLGDKAMADYAYEMMKDQFEGLGLDDSGIKQICSAMFVVNISFTPSTMTMSALNNSETANVTYTVEGGKIYIKSEDDDDRIIVTVSGNTAVFAPEDPSNDDEFASMTLEKGAAKTMTEEELTELMMSLLGMA